MSITMDRSTADRLRRYSRRERRSVSQVIQIALERFLDERVPAVDRIVTTPGSFRGQFSREETYGTR